MHIIDTYPFNGMYPYFYKGAYITAPERTLPVKERKTGKKLGEMDIGGEIWFDSDVRGSYQGCAIIRTAYAYGFHKDEGRFKKGIWVPDEIDFIMKLSPDEADKLAEFNYQDSYDTLLHDLEWYCDLWIEAENYLSYYFLLPENYWIGTNEIGDFGIFRNEDEDYEDEDYEE